MNPQVALLLETPQAVAADVRRLPGVRPNVVLQARRVRRHVVAHVAKERSLVRRGHESPPYVGHALLPQPYRLRSFDR